MNKFFVLIFTILYLIMSINITYAESAQTKPDNPTTKVEISFKVGDSTLKINGKDVAVEKPFVVNGVTLVPLRVITEAFGAQVTWNSSERSILIVYAGVSIKLFIDKEEATVDGSNITLLEAPTIVNGYTMVPLRFITENFGANVKYDSATAQITVTKEIVGEINKGEWQEANKWEIRVIEAGTCKVKDNTSNFRSTSRYEIIEPQQINSTDKCINEYFDAGFSCSSDNNLKLPNYCLICEFRCTVGSVLNVIPNDIKLIDSQGNKYSAVDGIPGNFSSSVTFLMGSGTIKQTYMPSDKTMSTLIYTSSVNNGTTGWKFELPEKGSCWFKIMFEIPEDVKIENLLWPEFEKVFDL